MRLYSSMNNMSGKAKKKSKSTETVMDLRVLGYIEKDGDWAAHCLETDLVGYGKTFEKAFSALKELTQIQIEFAIFKNEISLLDHPAPPHIIELWHSTQRWQLEHLISKPKKAADTRHTTRIIPLYPPSNTDFSFVQA